MEILINDMPAVLKQKLSFDFVCENRYFSGADAYSMTISFPLKHCAQNLSIFGHINRVDVEKGNLKLPCTIRHGKFVKSGSIAITAIDDVEVKTQFLEGRSADNYASSFDDCYINELELGYPDTTPSSVAASRQNGYDQGAKWLCYPWVNNNTGNVQNDMYVFAQHTHWESSVKGLSFQPYLIYIVGLILEKLGYTYDFTKWIATPYRHLIICNALPYAWEIKNWAAALPHWTVTELLEQLEYLMNCEFDVDHIRKHVSYQTSHEAITNSGEVTLSRVLDDYSVSVEDAASCKYRERQNFMFAECDHKMQKYHSCPKFIEDHRKFLRQNTEWRDVDTIANYASQVQPYLATTEPYKAGIQQCVTFVKDVDCYFVLRMVSNVIEGHATDLNLPYGTSYRFMQPINRFAPLIMDEDADTIELKIVPAWIDDTTPEKGQVIFLPLGDYGTDIKNQELTPDEAFAQMRTNGDYYINNMTQQESTEFLDKLYVAFSEGIRSPLKYPRPTIDTIEVMSDGGYFSKPHSLSLQFAYFKDSHYARKIDPIHKYSFKFLSDDIPNVRALFYIKGKQFICEKITATFNEHGMSQLLKGDFYEVVG